VSLSGEISIKISVFLNYFIFLNGISLLLTISDTIFLFQINSLKCAIEQNLTGSFSFQAIINIILDYNVYLI
jgi:hypothetical protein